MAQDVVTFRARTQAEKYQRLTDDVPVVLESQLNACLLVSPLAELLYQARVYWIGGQALPWKELTADQKFQARLEIERLIKGER